MEEVTTDETSVEVPTPAEEGAVEETTEEAPAEKEATVPEETVPAEETAVKKSPDRRVNATR